MQELWAVRLDWDDELPPPLATSWDNFLQQLQDTNTFSIPRWLGLQPSAIAVELHGFADASQAALAAVIYLRVCSDLDDIRVTIVAAKTKVAPLKPVTIPRLELAAAVLLVRQISHIRKTLVLESAPIHLWTDSTVALAWIKSHPSLRKDFVRNRVAEIQELSTARWHQVAERENPADCASRSGPPEHKLWWSGPKWLQKHSTSWPSANPSPPLDADLEERTKIVTTPGKEDVLVWDLVDRFSMLTKLIRITAWCMRVVPQFPRLHPRTTSQPPLSPTELDTACLFWVKSTQEAYFRTEIELLKSGKQLPRSHPLLRLSPFVDAASLLRVGGRRRHSQLDPDEKHPLILPRDSAFTTLVLDYYHRRTLHGGTQLTLSTLRQLYWILGGRVPVRAFIHRCVPCVRQRALTGQQLMGQLPEARVSKSRPFLNSGVDYAGPITLKTFSGRGTKTYKGYIAIFVCLASSAIHLEVITDYATSGFIAAYKRFTGRRGICATIRSDCGTNLIGADAELRKMFTASSKEWAHIANLLANDGTKWHFNPPSSPHFGGKWEAGVKSVKFHLKRVIGDALLTYEGMSTFLAQVEAVLNSRPLCPLSDDPSDLLALTPGHLLISSALTTIPEPTLLDVPTSRLSRWQLFRQMIEKFWLRWSAEYLQHLQSLTKWQLQEDSLKIGFLVLVKDERLPPSKWALARVTDVHPGADNLVRVVTVKTQSSVFKRPVVKLCLLPVSAAS